MAGIPIRVEPYFWLMAALIGWLSTLSLPETFLWVGIIFVSVVVHELGHALTARAFGQRAVITLVGMGGVTQRSGKKLSFWKEFLIILNGPLFGFLLAIAAYFVLEALHSPPSIVTNILAVMVNINIFWTVFNLFPIEPLDGGHLLRLVLEAIFGMRGTKMALFFSMCLAGALGMVFFAAGLLIGGIIFFFFTFDNFRAWKSLQGVTDQDVDKGLWMQIKAAEADTHAGNYDTAIAKLQKLRQEVPTGMISVAAAERIAEALLKKGEMDKAYDLLLSLRKSLSLDFLSILHQLAFKTGHIKVAAEVGDKVYQEAPTYQVALINAMSRALLGEDKPAVGWLRCAYNEGTPHFDEVIRRAEFDPIRSSPLFQSFVASKNP